MGHTGAMIALIPTPADAARLALPGYEPEDELHLTLWYLGDAADYPDDTFDGLVNAITSMVTRRRTPTVDATVFGVDLWNPTSDEPAWVLAISDVPDGEGVAYYRTEVKEAWLDGLMQLDMPEQHSPWVAHVCLAYAPATADLLADMTTRVGPITFDRVRVAFGDQVADVQLVDSGSTVADMPWHKVQNHDECPSSKPWAVVKDSDGSVAGCHATESEADDQLAALYASENDSSASEETMTEHTATLTVEGQLITADNAPIADETEPAVRPWTGPLCVEGVTTGDGREFAVNALTWADPPLPLRWNKEDSHGGLAQTVAVNVGRIDQVWRDGSKIMGSGVINMQEEDGRRVYALLKGQFLKGVSIDADDIGDSDIEYVWPVDGKDVESGEDDILSILFATPEKVVYHAGRIRAATLCDIPAFTEAYIALDEDAVESLTASAAPSNLFDLTTRGLATGVATEVSEQVSGPPRSWFEDPQLSVIVPLTITSDGRVYGHAAQWGQCHIGVQDECVTPPREPDHPYFMMGELCCADGSVVRVGQITVDTTHASAYLDAARAVDHYANTGCVVADVAVGNDRHGIWMAGALRSTATPAQVHALRAAGQVSGDWRRIGGQLRLVGLLAVNVPGYPIERPRARVADGQPQALIAAGRLTLAEGTPEGRTNELDEGALRLLKDAIARRVESIGGNRR